MSWRSSRAIALALVVFATFVDIVAYSIAVPVLPDLTKRLGASATTIGLLFGSFGATLLIVSIPMGALSDRVGRRGPMIAGLLALSAASAAFGVGHSLAALFAARLLQGAADAITWVVGFALIADAYDPSERGRVTGVVMASASVAYMLGPSLGGWLYEVGGVQLPFFFLAGLALLGAIGFIAVRVPDRRTERDRVPLAAIIREPPVVACVLAVVAVAATMAMIEPVLALHLEGRVGLGPARIGMVFAGAAVANVFLHPVFGALSDRWGARRLTIVGLFATAAVVPLLARAWSFESAVLLNVLQAVAFAIVVTPSLSYMGAAVSSVGLGSFGVAYGLYNMAWGVGLLGGPALGGWMFERLGFAGLGIVWAPALALVTLAIARVRSKVLPKPGHRPGPPGDRPPAARDVARN
jgi:MFS family permease